MRPPGTEHPPRAILALYGVEHLNHLVRRSRQLAELILQLAKMVPPASFSTGLGLEEAQIACARKAHKVDNGGGAEACSSVPQAARLATLATLRPPMGVWGKMGYLVPDLNSWPSEGAQLGRASAICSKRLLAPVALRGRLVRPPAGWRRSGAVRRAWGEHRPWPTTGGA